MPSTSLKKKRDVYVEEVTVTVVVVVVVAVVVLVEVTYYNKVYEFVYLFNDDVNTPLTNALAKDDVPIMTKNRERTILSANILAGNHCWICR